MADFTQTIVNSMAMLGMGPATRYSAASWGSGIWGEGSNDFIQKIGKFFGNSITVGDSLSKQVNFMRTFSNSMIVTVAAVQETLQDGSGYFYVFKRPSTDAEDRTNAVWVQQSGGAVSFTCVAGADTIWSEQ
jgi:hypothetical protein